jgi:hypothetical protein
MFVYWKAKVNQGDFDTWRKQQVEMIGQYLDKLHWNETPASNGRRFSYVAVSSNVFRWYFAI